MTDEHVEPTPPRVQLILGGMVLGLLIVIAVFLSRYPLECGDGYRVTTTWLTQWCSVERSKVGSDSTPESLQPAKDGS